MIAMGHSTPPIRPVLQMLQLYAKDCSLHSLHPIVEPNLIVIIALRGSMFTQRTRAGGIAGIVGHERAAFTIGSKVLPRIEAKARHFTKRPDLATVVESAMRLRGIFDHRQSMLPRNHQNGVEINGVSIKVDGKNRLCARANGPFNSSRIEVVCLRIDINVDGPRPDVRNGPTGSYE